MLRNIIAGFAGIVVAGLLVWLVEMLGHAAYPPPADLNFADAGAMRTYIETLPVGALLFVAAAWFVGTLGGTLVACRLGNAKPVVYAIVVGGLILVATAFNLAMIPHPLWFSVLGVAGIVAAAWLGMTLGSRPAGEAE